MDSGQWTLSNHSTINHCHKFFIRHFCGSSFGALFWTRMVQKISRYHFFILIPCIIDYVEINQLNALNYIFLYFSFAMAPTCFGKTMPYSGSDYVPFWATSASIWQETSHRTYDGTYIPACYRRAIWHAGSGSDRKVVALWGWHCFTETCRSHCEKK
jgi:hypothetical protein